MIPTCSSNIVKLVEELDVKYEGIEMKPRKRVN